MANVSDRAALLWFFCYPHADRDGRLPADPKDLAALCLPRIMLEFRWTIPDIEAARDELLSSGLWLQVDGDPPGVEIARFREHQAGYKYDREAPSKFTAGQLARTREDSRPLATTKTQVQVQVQDQVEGEVQAPARAKSEERAKDTHTLKEIDGGRQEVARLLEPTIIAEWKSVHPLGERCVPRLTYPADYDRRAIQNSAHALQLMTSAERMAFWKRAEASLPADRKTIEAALAMLNNPEIVGATDPGSRFSEAFRGVADWVPDPTAIARARGYSDDDLALAVAVLQNEPDTANLFSVNSEEAHAEGMDRLLARARSATRPAS